MLNLKLKLSAPNIDSRERLDSRQLYRVPPPDPPRRGEFTVSDSMSITGIDAGSGDFKRVIDATRDAAAIAAKMGGVGGLKQGADLRAAMQGGRASGNDTSSHSVEKIPPETATGSPSTSKDIAKRAAIAAIQFGSYMLF